MRAKICSFGLFVICFLSSNSVAGDVRVEVIPTPRHISAHQPVLAHVTLTNVGSEAIAIPKDPSSAVEFFLYLEVETEGQITSSRITTRPQIDGYKTPMLLQPGETLQSDVILWCDFEQGEYLFNESGVYSYRLVWRQPNTDERFRSNPFRIEVDRESAEDHESLDALLEVGKRWMGFDQQQWTDFANHNGEKADALVQINLIKSMILEQLPRQHRQDVLSCLSTFLEQHEESILAPYVSNYLGRSYLEQLDANPDWVARPWNETKDPEYQQAKDHLSFASRGPSTFVAARSTYNLAELYIYKGMLSGDFLQAEQQAALFELRYPSVKIKGRSALEQLQRYLSNAKRNRAQMERKRVKSKEGP